MKPLCLWTAAVLLPAQSPEALTAHLRATPLVHADFTQTRTLKALTKPLVSRGSVVVDQGRGILWQVKKPLALTFVVTPKGVLEVGPDGRRKVQTAQDAPMVAEMGRILKALVEGRFSALEGWFSLQGSGTPDRWEIRLAPKAAAAAFLKGATLQGGRTLERLRLVEPGGDTSEVVFTGTRTDQPLSDPERALLDLK